MDYKYKVTFAHEDDTQEDAYGWGTADITTDVPVETDEQLKEVARSIGVLKGFTKVGIIKIDDAED